MKPASRVARTLVNNFLNSKVGGDTKMSAKARHNLEVRITSALTYAREQGELKATEEWASTLPPSFIDDLRDTLKQLPEVSH